MGGGGVWRRPGSEGRLWVMDPLQQKFEALKAASDEAVAQLMEGTADAVRQTRALMRPAARHWLSGAILRAELGEPLQKFLVALPKDWRSNTEVVLSLPASLAVPARLLPSPDPRVNAVGRTTEAPTEAQWRDWLDRFSDAARQNIMLPPYATHPRWPKLVGKGLALVIAAATVTLIVRRP